MITFKAFGLHWRMVAIANAFFVIGTATAPFCLAAPYGDRKIEKAACVQLLRVRMWHPGQRVADSRCMVAEGAVGVVMATEQGREGRVLALLERAWTDLNFARCERAEAYMSNGKGDPALHRALLAASDLKWERGQARVAAAMAVLAKRK